MDRGCRRRPANRSWSRRRRSHGSASKLWSRGTARKSMWKVRRSKVTRRAEMKDILTVAKLQAIKEMFEREEMEQVVNLDPRPLQRKKVNCRVVERAALPGQIVNGQS